MSFILDALKKAESERSRQIGPVLMDVRIAPPRQRLPTWAWVLGCVLLANLLVLVLVWLLPRTPAPAPAITAGAAASANPAPPAVAAPPPAAQSIAAPVTAIAAPPPLSAPGTAIITAPVRTVPEAALDVDGLPTMQEVLASGVTLPALVLNLHVYDPAPGNRYVLLNSRRLLEGEELADGIRVERITEHGVVLEARGRRFLLVAGG